MVLASPSPEASGGNHQRSRRAVSNARLGAVSVVTNRGNLLVGEQVDTSDR